MSHRRNPHIDSSRIAAVLSTIDKVCHSCGRKGHLSNVCLSGDVSKAAKVTKGPQQQQQPTQQQKKKEETETAGSAGKAGAITYAVNTVRDTVRHRISMAREDTERLQNPTPRFETTVHPVSRGGRSFDIRALPDTGATVTVISRDIAMQNSLRVTVCTHEKLYAADDSPLDVTGSTLLRINNVPIRALVTESIVNDMLIGWKDLIRLNIIPENFPKPMCNNAVRALTSEKDVERAADCTRELIKDFPTVLREDFDSGPLKGRPMDIELRTDCLLYTSPSPRDRG